MRICTILLTALWILGLSFTPWQSRLGLWAADEEELFWSFQPVRPLTPPPTQNKEWSRSPIDQFVLAKLEQRGLSPSSPADRRILLRRTTFDLTGLPPTPQEVDAFLADDSPDAFAEVVDRLLASPQYGERWGRHWLDVVRYADARDLIQLPAESDFREAWRYRDWVVASFNRDLPYDQFVARQVAGDLLQPADPNRLDADALVATGMLAIADFVPGDVDKQQMIADYVNDQIDVVGRAFLGLTIACARCHDHKFDPITIDDYYSLAGIFFSTRLVPGPVKGNTPLVRAALLPPAEIAALEASQARNKARLAELAGELKNASEREYRSYLERRVTSETPRYLLAAWEVAHLPGPARAAAVSAVAKEQKLDEVAFGHWVAYFEDKQPHPALAGLRASLDKATAELRTRELSEQLSTFAVHHHIVETPGATANSRVESAALHFRADDRRVVTNDAHKVTLWPNRGRLLQNAKPAAEVASPLLTTTLVDQHARSVLRFSGKELLQVAGMVPEVGTLFVVFRPDPTGPSGQRLIGWEDAAVGQHGLGIMTDATGAVHAIVRRNGANGDVLVPAPVPTQHRFQVLCITWGQDGIAVRQNGQAAGNNKAINSVSSDPAIAALQIGGPGSGSSPRFHGDLAELRVYSRDLDDKSRSRVEAELANRWCVAETETSDNPVEDLYEELVSAQSPFRLDEAARDQAFSNDFRQRLAGLREEFETLQKLKPVEIPRAVVVQEGGPPGTPHEGFRDAQVYLRGDHLKPGKTVPRGFPKVIAGINPPTIQQSSGRRELADWLIDPHNPLTARVMVNRIWQHHFGVGLVATSANFGQMGESPSHPELLDFLANRFVESGWSVKAMHRLIMLSSVYRQSSAGQPANLNADPENRLLWRANRRKLEAEAIRDSLFAVSGRLNLAPHGPGFQDLATPRRTLYLMAVRTGAKTAEFSSLFDSADCSGIVERRTETIVAPQALFLMNDSLVIELAKSLGNRIAHEVPAGDYRLRIQRLYEITLCRLPTDEEIEVGLQLLADRTRSDAWSNYCRVVLCTNEFMFVD
ncbi:MAG: Protein of unknown function (DUF1553)/Protein of unknown function (DUF1549)/Planctomycete [Schlesneria sp.]|nr:Protein of unknown function (DUF1553)/Protein of unknown function (DUF1549)/Planctomycete [Schlesneria sp.]